MGSPLGAPLLSPPLTRGRPLGGLQGHQDVKIPAGAPRRLRDGRGPCKGSRRGPQVFVHLSLRPHRRAAAAAAAAVPAALSAAVADACC